MRLLILFMVLLFSGSCSSEPIIFKPVNKTVKVVKPHQVDLKTYKEYRSKAEVLKVMVIDSGISKHKDLLKYVKYVDGSADYEDPVGHGTHVAGIIALGENLKDPLCHNVEIHSCSGAYSSEQISTCVNRAIKENFKYINISLSGSGASYTEFMSLRAFLNRKGTKVIVSAGNGDNINGYDLTKNPQYPAGYIDGFKFRGKVRHLPKGFFVVQNMCPDGICQTSNTHPLAVSANGFNLYSTNINNSYEYRNGTSQAAPNYLHTILKQECEKLKIKLINE